MGFDELTLIFRYRLLLANCTDNGGTFRGLGYLLLHEAFIGGDASDLLDGSNFVQSVAAVDTTPRLRRVGRAYARWVKRDFQT